MSIACLFVLLQTRSIIKEEEMYENGSVAKLVCKCKQNSYIILIFVCMHIMRSIAWIIQCKISIELSK